jgi:alpha-galactosidase
MTSRREFLDRMALAAMGLSLPAIARAESVSGDAHEQTAPVLRSFLDLRRAPDRVVVHTATGERKLVASAGGRFTASGVEVTTIDAADALRVRLASSVAVLRVGMRWHGRLRDTRLLLGDAWERGYGDLEWRGFVPDRAMPWYVMAWDGQRTHGYGVRTNPKAMCCWQVDADGITLWADVRAGGVGVLLGARTLDVCDVVCRAGRVGESPFAATHAFCRQMCPSPRMPAKPVYGSNDWYWAYGKNSAQSVLADAQHIVELSPDDANRPFAVIDDGWQPGRGADKAGTGTWDKGNDKFPDLPRLVADIRRAGARAGVWVRPLQAHASAPDTWRLARDRERAVLDPTVPEVRAKIAEDIARVRAWGFELIKHDYTTYELLGRWGSQMGTAMTRDGWTFASGPTHTTAEVIDELYRTIQTAAGDTLVIGCNTVSHLSAGRFQITRTGDDTSGTEWSRTRKMGVNTLAFRAAQHGAFYAADADCVGVTNAVPWSLTRQWLDLLARSGTPLFVSLAPDALGVDQRRDLRAALAIAARPQPLGQPVNWQQTTFPTEWRLMGAPRSYNWGDVDGMSLPG